MLSHRAASFAVLGALALGACATKPYVPTGAAAVPSPPGKEECVWFNMVSGWGEVDRDRLLLYGPGNTTYLATLAIPETNLTWDWAVGFQDRDHDGRICGNGFDEIVVRDPPNRILITSLKRLSKEDAKAFQAAVHPRRGKSKPRDETDASAGAAK
jgi:hypothetical protein